MPSNSSPTDPFSNLFDLPIPSGAAADEWCDLTEYLEDVHRCLTWSRHDAAGYVVGVEGAQYVDARIERFVTLRPDSADVEMTAADARKLAGALLDAAESLDSVR